MENIIKGFDVTNHPKNMYFSYMVGGRKQSLKHQRLTFGLPVLAIVQARQDSNDWFIVTYRTLVTPDILNMYYTDEQGVMLELHPLYTEKDAYKLGDISAIDTLFYNTTEGLHEVIGITYKKCLELTNSIEREEVDYETLYDFLSQYRNYVENEHPSLLI